MGEAELDKAKNEILRDFILTRQTVQTRGEELGYAAVVLKDANLVNTELARFLAVTPADIQRVATKYFVPQNMTLVEVYPKDAGDAIGGAKIGRRMNGGGLEWTKRTECALNWGDRPPWGRAFCSWSAALLLAACAGAREYPPEPLPPKPLVLPTPELRTLPNGLKVVVIERHLLPLLTLRLVVKSGAEADPAGLPGTAQLVSSLLTEGTTTRNASQISESIDSMGGLVDSGAGWDESYLTLSVLNDHEQLAFDLLSDMVMHSSLRAG